MARPKNSRDIAPEIRGAFLRAMKIKESKGHSLSDMLLEAVDEHGILKVLDTMSKFNPKTVDANVSGAVSIEDFVNNTVAAQQEHDASADNSIH